MAKRAKQFDEYGRDWGYDDRGLVFIDRHGERRYGAPAPAPPPQPSEEDLRTYHSDTYRANPVRIGMRLPDMAGVLEALSVFGGKSAAPLARAAQESGADSMGVGIALQAELTMQMGGFGFGGGQASFVDRLLKSVPQQIEERGSYYESWDWDGPGPFCKAIIKVAKLDDGTFELHISRQRDPEPGLAQQLGAPMAFYRVEHAIAWKTEGLRFAIPMDPIRQAATLYGATSFDPEDIFARLSLPRLEEGGYRTDDYTPVLLHENDDMRLSLSYIGWRVPSFFDLSRTAQAENGEFDRLGDGPDDYRPRLETIDGAAVITGRAKLDHHWDLPISAGVELTAYAKNHYNKDAEARILDHARLVDGLFAGWAKPF